MFAILTGKTGTNADLLPDALQLYVPDGAAVADVTWGRGVFWKQIEPGRYNVLKSDLADGIDFRALPYPDASVDALVLDPPYMHGGVGIKESLNACYGNERVGHESIIRLYGGGILEAARVLKKGGVIFVKCQDEKEGSRQRLSHIEIIGLLEVFGFKVEDLFLLVQDRTPIMRYDYQKSARKNHSYLVVARFRR